MLIGLLSCCVTGATAQTFEEYRKRIQSEFNQYKSDTEREFKEYRDRINAEFAEYMRQTWPEYKAKPAKPVPPSPEPPKPVVKEPDTPPSNDPIPYDEVIPAPKPVTPPQPPVPIPEPTVTPKPTFSFRFYGETCRLPLENKHRFSLSAVDENGVANGWKKLSDEIYLPVVKECLAYREQMQLCDWGYVLFVDKATSSFFPSDRQNEARLMSMFILTQSGYKVRIARSGNKLVLLLPSKDPVYQYSYLTLNGCNYYVFDKSLKRASFNVFDREFPKEQFFSLRMNQLPVLPVTSSSPRKLISKFGAGLSVNIQTNRNLTDFLNDYPLSDKWNLYSSASLSDYAKEQLYPVLKQAISGKEKAEAANILLRFIQTAFEYQTDEEQFGYERPFFADETLFYPYCDCEDRAILYSILVRELLGLDVVLVYYPGHLASAVCFDSEVRGDYFTINNRRYVVCDPTYINADIGQAMPQFKETNARIVRID